MLVLDDADLDAAVDGAVRGSFVGAGQVCVSLERIYVHESLFERFATRFVDRVKAMKLYAEETFGPVVALFRYSDEDAAIARANDTRYGLNGSVWSRSAKHALRVAKRLQVDTVNVNESYAATWPSTAAPIGGSFT